MPAIASDWGARRWLPRWTLRLRLTLLYGALFLAAGAVLLAITYGLVAHSGSVGTKNAVVVSGRAPIKGLPQPPPGAITKDAKLVYAGPNAPSHLGLALRDFTGKVTSAAHAQILRVASEAQAQLDHQRSAQLDALITKSGVALGIMAFVSIGLGWLMAGRALRPVRTMGARARGISERNLHERLALEGPDDELKELGDTFDGLLARLDSAFESQRRFVANASHELRTPITLSRTLVEVSLADPRASIGSLRDTCERVLAAGEQQERLIEALLTLARSQRGLDSRVNLDLAAIAAELVRVVGCNGVDMQSELGQAFTIGDPALVERLVANLIDNALQYNEPDGWVRTWTGVRNGSPTVLVANTGPVIPADQTDALSEPFRRLNGGRTGHDPGLGLGLSIVSAIATAHDARFTATARPDGGLVAEVAFPPA